MVMAVEGGVGGGGAGAGGGVIVGDVGCVGGIGGGGGGDIATGAVGVGRFLRVARSVVRLVSVTALRLAAAVLSMLLDTGWLVVMVAFGLVGWVGLVLAVALWVT